MHIYGQLWSYKYISTYNQIWSYTIINDHILIYDQKWSCITIHNLMLWHIKTYDQIESHWSYIIKGDSLVKRKVIQLSQSSNLCILIPSESTLQISTSLICPMFPHPGWSCHIICVWSRPSSVRWFRLWWSHVVLVSALIRCDHHGNWIAPTWSTDLDENRQESIVG